MRPCLASKAWLSSNRAAKTWLTSTLAGLASETWLTSNLQQFAESQSAAEGEDTGGNKRGAGVERDSGSHSEYPGLPQKRDRPCRGLSARPSVSRTAPAHARHTSWSASTIAYGPAQLATHCRCRYSGITLAKTTANPAGMFYQLRGKRPGRPST